MDIETYELSAKILVKFFGWEWHKEKSRSLVGLFPPENDELGYNKINWAESLFENVTGHENKFTKFQDWFDLCYFVEPDKKWFGRKNGIPNIANDKNLCNILLIKIQERKLVGSFIEQLRGKFELRKSDKYYLFDFVRASSVQICEAALRALEEVEGFNQIQQDKKDVHTEHCCVKCGCKYGDDRFGDEGCSVVSKLKKQSYPCEYCDKGETGDEFDWE